MTSSIIPLVTAADRALAREMTNLFVNYLAEGSEMTAAKLTAMVEVRLAKHRVEGFVSFLMGGEPSSPDTPAPYRKGRLVVGESPRDTYHWRRCE